MLLLPKHAHLQDFLKVRVNGTWTPKVCKIMAFMAVIMGLGLLFYILLGFRHALVEGLCEEGGVESCVISHSTGLGFRV